MSRGLSWSDLIGWSGNSRMPLPRASSSLRLRLLRWAWPEEGDDWKLWGGGGGGGGRPSSARKESQSDNSLLLSLLTGNGGRGRVSTGRGGRGRLWRALPVEERSPGAKRSPWEYSSLESCSPRFRSLGEERGVTSLLCLVRTTSEEEVVLCLVPMMARERREKHEAKISRRNKNRCVISNHLYTPTIN